jgi:hypothetical protein
MPGQPGELDYNADINPVLRGAGKGFAACKVLEARHEEASGHSLELEWNRLLGGKCEKIKLGRDNSNRISRFAFGLRSGLSSTWPV